MRLHREEFDRSNMSNHIRFVARTVLVKNGDYEVAYRALDRYSLVVLRVTDFLITPKLLVAAQAFLMWAIIGVFNLPLDGPVGCHFHWF